MLIGYARVSTTHQNLDRQIGALRAVACDDVYAEKASGKQMRDRPELEKAIDALGTGDVLVLAEWDRATRSMMDGIAIMQRVNMRGAAIRGWTSHTSISRPGWGKASSPSCLLWRRTSANVSTNALLTAAVLPGRVASGWAAAIS